MLARSPFRLACGMVEHRRAPEETLVWFQREDKRRPFRHATAETNGAFGGGRIFQRRRVRQRKRVQFAEFPTAINHF